MLSPLKESTPALAGQSVRVLLWDGDLVDMWCLDEDGTRVPYRGAGSLWHFHPDLELTLITRGAGTLCVGDHIGRFSAPDCVLLGRDVPHVWRSAGALAGISLQFPLEALGGLAALPEFGRLDQLWARARYGLRWQGASAARLHAQLDGLDGQPALARLAACLAIVDTMARAPLADAAQLSGRLLVQEHAPRTAALTRVLDHVMENFSEELELADMVRLSGMAQATFCRQFAKATGRTFTAYLNAIRIQEVRRALLESERSVTDIAFGAGFSNLSHFHAVFRAAAGCTPLAFRKAHRVG